MQRWRTSIGQCRHHWRRASAVLTALVVALTMHPLVAMAQDAPVAQTGTGEKSYVNQYFLVIMCIALGMALICKPSKREERVKPLDEFD